MGKVKSECVAFRCDNEKEQAMDDKTAKLLLTRHEAALVLSVSVRTLDSLLAQGELSTRRIGRRRLIPRSELERFARRNCERVSAG